MWPACDCSARPEKTRWNRPHAEDDDVKAFEVHLPRVRDYVAKEKAQAREVREIQCDSVRDWIKLRRSKTAEAGANPG